jgi:hypothetical protein
MKQPFRLDVLLIVVVFLIESFTVAVGAEAGVGRHRQRQRPQDVPEVSRHRIAYGRASRGPQGFCR